MTYIIRFNSYLARTVAVNDYPHGCYSGTGIGIPRSTVSKILNHVEPGVTAVYDRYSYDKEKREAINGIDD